MKTDSIDYITKEKNIITVVNQNEDSRSTIVDDKSNETNSARHQSSPLEPGDKTVDSSMEKQNLHRL
jgi:hypothetical protein